MSNNSADWRIFYNGDGTYAGGKRGAMVAAHVAIYGLGSFLEQVDYFLNIPVTEERIHEWDAAITKVKLFAELSQ